MNLGTVAGWGGAGFSALTSIGYFIAGDIRRGLYFAFAFAITLTVIWR
jgi:hypothetical protein